MEKSQEDLLDLLKKGIAPATGCTEPIAVAYAVAKAKEQSMGNLSYIQVEVDSNIYKNGLMVTIPGTTERGLLAAAAMVQSFTIQMALFILISDNYLKIWVIYVIRA